MNTLHYIVRLTPVGCYFFGGEVTFGEGGKQNYYVKSNLLPQASSLLGLMRYEVLRQRGKLSYSKDDLTLREVEALIGQQGFSVNHKIESYGIIQGISPVFIEDRSEQRFYTRMPLDEGIDFKYDEDIECSFSSSCNQRYGVSLKGYDYKNYSNYKYWISGDLHKIDEDSIFYDKEQIGITKNGRKQNEQDAFFKMVTVGLKSGYNFVFTFEVSQEINEVADEIVFLGGNRSAFRMSITRFADGPDFFCRYFSGLHKEGRWLLLSDAFFTDEERNRIPFFWATSICNRYILTSHKKGHSWRLPEKTDLYYLLSRGGVIYTDEALQPDLHLNHVGLNIFV